MNLQLQRKHKKHIDHQHQTINNMHHALRKITWKVKQWVSNEKYMADLAGFQIVFIQNVFKKLTCIKLNS